MQMIAGVAGDRCGLEGPMERSVSEKIERQVTRVTAADFTLLVASHSIASCRQQNAIQIFST
jgi:hypothetical protein